MRNSRISTAIFTLGQFSFSMTLLSTFCTLRFQVVIFAFDFGSCLQEFSGHLREDIPF